ncbi:myoD family inhibitor isoform X8 [Pseudorca crassidens]|uniref:myoD family inhibitor isoform X8 n=1 Tax=Pseudorca crassidens TaxID=82174 RepID=UPI00352D8B33
MQQTDPGWLPEFQAGPRTRLRGRGSRTPSSRPGGPPLPAEATWPHRGDAASGGESPGDHGGPGLDGAARTFERRPGPMSQVSGQRPPHCDAPHGAPSAAPGPGQPQGNPLGCTPLVANGSGHPSELGGTRRTGNGALGGPKVHRKLQTHPSLASQGSKKSKGSTKSAASQIPLQAQEDCCVHCILSCLFCEFLTLCNIVLDCATCGSCSSEDSCLCCCCCGSGECADCDLPCDLDCGILDACCESADCLEICMECCGLCFSS